METKNAKTSLAIQIDESSVAYSYGSDIRIAFYSYDKDRNRMINHQSLYLTEDEFKEFREMIRDFYTKKEQEEHFAMMSQRDPEAPDYSKMVTLVDDKGFV